MNFVVILEGVEIEPNVASWTRNVTDSEDEFIATVKLPTQKGTYKSIAKLYEILISGKNLLSEETLNIEVSVDRYDLTTDLMNAISSLEFSIKCKQNCGNNRDQAL